MNSSREGKSWGRFSATEALKWPSPWSKYFEWFPDGALLDKKSFEANATQVLRIHARMPWKNHLDEVALTNLELPLQQRVKPGRHSLHFSCWRIRTFRICGIQVQPCNENVGSNASLGTSISQHISTIFGCQADYCTIQDDCESSSTKLLVLATRLTRNH